MMTLNRTFTRNLAAALCLLAIPAATLLAADTTAQPKKKAKAKKEAPLTPGGKWRAHDQSRPQPAVVTPPTASTPAKAGQPPSDAIVLFDGKDFAHWRIATSKTSPNPSADAPKWKIENGYMEIVPQSGSIITTDKFADCQIHVEWAAPAEVKGSSQGRGNSGFFLVGHPEIQVLDSCNNPTYPDGSAAAIYGYYPPLVNASRKPGEWQSYDIIYLAPKVADGNVVKPAGYTLFHNGVLVHHAVEVPGSDVECPIYLQDHKNPVRYRNIWVRRLKGYPE